jgi:hypothetical protein
LSFFITAGPISDYTGAVTLLDNLPNLQAVPYPCKPLKKRRSAR